MSTDPVQQDDTYTDPLEVQDYEDAVDPGDDDLAVPDVDHTPDPDIAVAAEEQALAKEIDAVARPIEESTKSAKSHLLPTDLIQRPLTVEDLYDDNLI